MMGWTRLTVDECIVKVATTEKIQRKDFLADGRFPIVSQEADFINGYWNDESALLRIHNPVVIFGDHTQVLKYIDFDFVRGADGVKILSPKQFLDPRFFYFALMAKPVRTLGYARHFRLIAKAEIAFPPLDEQRRIVAILDEAFAGLAAMRQHAEVNLKNARALFDSHLNAIFSQRGEGWVERRFGDICENLDSRRVPITKRDRASGSIPYYGASGIVDYVSEHIFDEDILLVSEDGANLLARTYPIAFSVSGKCWVNNHAHVVSFDEIATQKFVELYLNSISLEPYVSGMAQPKLNQKALNSIPIPLPDVRMQRKIIDAAQELFSGVERLEALYRQKVAAVDELKQSILHQAFSGALSAKDALAA